ncbi:MAG: glycosyltransferase [Actinomycetota bacterium]
MNGLLLFIGGVAATFWLAALFSLTRGFRTVPILNEVAPLPDEECPRISVIVPACNEEATVETPMRSLLALDYPGLEIIAVEDRSTDATGRILDRLATENARLRVLHLDRLPEGWLGKNHALHEGAAQANGDWLLFTDADVVYTPDALRRALRLATEGDWDHLVVYPRMESHGFWERVFISFFMVIFNVRFRAWDAANPKSRAYVGVGGFNLVRKSVYAALGGHERLRMDVADDLHLGKLIKRSGYRQRLAEAGDRISVRWAIGLRGVIHVLTKNAFAGHGYSWGMVLHTTLGLGMVTLWPYFGLLTGPPLSRTLCGVALIAMVLLQWFFARRGGVSAWNALGWPLAGGLFLFITYRSGLLAHRQRGVYWRGTFYRLEDLRQGMLRG